MNKSHPIPKIKQFPNLFSYTDLAAYAIFLLAIINRFAELGKLPLSPIEATNSLAVWHFWQPELFAHTFASPAYATLTSLFTQILGFHDHTMRFVPALASLFLIILPWLWRKEIGDIAALTTSLLLTISPIQLYFARFASGDTLALIAILLTVIFFLRYQKEATDRTLLFLLLSLAFGLTTAPLFYNGLLTFATAWLIQKYVGPTLYPHLDHSVTSVVEAEPVVLESDNSNDADMSSEIDEEKEPAPVTEKKVDYTFLKRPLIAALILLLALSTELFMNLQGVGDTSSILASWLKQFNFSGRLLTPLLLIGRYELPLIILGLFALIWTAIGERPLASLFVYWIVATLLLILFQWGTEQLALLLTVPAYLMIALFTEACFNSVTDHQKWWVAVGVSLFGALFVSNFARFARTLPSGGDSTIHQFYLFIALIALIAMIIALSIIYLTGSESISIQGGLIGLLLIFFFYSWGTGWWLTHFAANDPRAWPTNEAADDDLRQLIQLTREISGQKRNGPAELTIFSTVETPLLAWYFRNFDYQSGSTFPQAIEKYDTLISPIDRQPPLVEAYTGADFGYRRLYEQPETFPETTTFFRWWLFHEDRTRLFNEERLILWLRTDMLN